MSLPQVHFVDEDTDITLFETHREVLNADTIFKDWAEMNLNIYTRVSNSNGSSITKLISCDQRCKTEQLHYHDYNLKQICKGCDQVRFLLKYPTVETHFQIRYGKHKGRIIELERLPHGNECYTKHDELKQLSNDMTRKSSKYLKSEFYKLDNIYYYTTQNKHVNRYMVSLLLNEIMKYKKFPLGPSFITGFSCCNTLMLLQYQADYSFHVLKNDYNFIRNLSPLSKKRHPTESFSKQTIVNMVKQIAIQCRFLANYYFIHNEASIKYLSFFIQTLNFEYESMHIQSSFKTVIEPSAWSSISLYNKQHQNWVRVSHCNTKIHNLGFPIEEIVPKYLPGQKHKGKYNIPYTPDYLHNRVLCYKIGNRLSSFNTIRRVGIPVFKSYDFVCFLTSLMMEPEFYNNFINTKYIEAWKHIWVNDDYDALMIDIKNNVKENNYETVSAIVAKYHVMIDALHYFFTFQT